LFLFFLFFFFDTCVVSILVSKITSLISEIYSSTDACSSEEEERMGSSTGYEIESSLAGSSMIETIISCS